MKPIDQLEAVLLDPDGEVCIHGSDVDKQVIKESLEQLRKERAELVEALNLYEEDMKRALAGEKFYPAVYQINETLRKMGR